MPQPGECSEKTCVSRVAGGARAVSPIKMTFSRVRMVDGQTVLVLVLRGKTNLTF